jgi:hypothetical protein
VQTNDFIGTYHFGQEPWDGVVAFLQRETDARPTFGIHWTVSVSVCDSFVLPIVAVTVRL